ncbi:MAG: NAD(P)H-binding protein [Rhodospirillaceae bacterium]|nr:NAD(P)H-binding protein [Rhodospirillaceae bacterium]
MIALFRACVVGLFALIAAAAPASAKDGGILVFGASGQLGSEIVKSLVGAGHDVSVFVRAGSKAERLAGLKVTTVTGDVLKDDDVAAALKAVKYATVIDALARGEAGPEFYITSQKHIAAWAKATGVKHVILHSSVGAGASRAIYPAAMLPRMGATLDAKEAGEKALMASGVAYTIIRNAVLMPHGTPATGKAKLYDDEAKYGSVTRADLAVLTLSCIDNPGCANKIYHAVDESLPVRR